jgi:anti-anti-sigma regulatory factor
MQDMMDIYQYDTPQGFYIRLVGGLDGGWVVELEHTCRCAASMLKGGRITLDIAGLTGASGTGLDALLRLRDAGARLVSSEPPVAPDLAAALRIPVMPGAQAPSHGWRTDLRSFLRGVFLREERRSCGVGR